MKVALAELKLSAFVELLEKEGLLSWPVLAKLGEEDLEKAGINKLAARKKIKAAAEKATKKDDGDDDGDD